MRLRFDGGTLLLDGDEGAADRMPGVRWDDRVGAFRAPASASPHLQAALDAPAGESRAPPLADRDAWLPIELRPYQESALLAWQLGGRRGLIALPTGSGKTVVALAAMARTGLAALCLVPTRVLLEQWVRAIEAVYRGPVGRFGDGERQVERVTVCTYESAHRTIHSLGNRFDLLVIDEAHHFGASLRDETLLMSLASARLGLTATPPRHGPQLEALHDLIGPVVYQRTVAELSGRYLAPFDHVTIRLELTAEESEAYEALMARFRPVHSEILRLAPGGGWSAFVRHATRSPEGRAALTAVRESRRLTSYTAGKRAALAELLRRHRDARVLVFTGNNQSAYQVAREQLVTPITCHIGRAERQEALDRFRTGEIRTLVSARVLNEGVDVPDAAVAIVLAGALGEREHVQRVGRVLRPGPGKRAIVYELVAAGTTEAARARKRREALARRKPADSYQ